MLLLGVLAVMGIGENQTHAALVNGSGPGLSHVVDVLHPWGAVSIET